METLHFTGALRINVNRYILTRTEPSGKGAKVDLRLPYLYDLPGWTPT